MKLNRKGFTLIELLVVVAILILIVGIAIPTITSSMNRSREKEKNNKINLIEEAGERYYNDHINTFNGNSIDIDTLISNGYLTNDEIKDPFNNDSIISGKVCCCINNNKKTFTYLESGSCSC